MRLHKRCWFILAWFSFAAVFAYGQAEPYKYIRIGSDHDASPAATAGYALMGGGPDLDEAFKFLCEHGAGGDFLILRAAGDDDYNPYVQQLCKVNSVATLIIASRAAAHDRRVADIIQHAEAIFIAGGDQARYINWWQDTAVQDALNAHIATGKPIGGTSAGLAVLGQFIYSAQGDAPDDPDLTSAQALADPYFQRVTVRRNFLKINLLHNTLTDTHFAKRNRMGRSLAFLARIFQDGWSPDPREIAVDESTAVLVEPDGKSQIVGKGKGAYFISVDHKPNTCRAHTPLTLENVAVYNAPSGTTFDLKNWAGSGGKSYSLTVKNGSVTSTQPGNEIY